MRFFKSLLELPLALRIPLAAGTAGGVIGAITGPILSEKKYMDACIENATSPSPKPDLPNKVEFELGFVFRHTLRYAFFGATLCIPPIWRAIRDGDSFTDIMRSISK